MICGFNSYQFEQGQVDCGITPEELIAYTDGSLSPQQLSLLEKHIPRCPHCQQRLANSAQIGDLIRHVLPQITPEQIEQSKASLLKKLRSAYQPDPQQ